MKIGYGSEVEGTRRYRLQKRRIDAMVELFRAKSVSCVDARGMIFECVVMTHCVWWFEWRC